MTSKMKFFIAFGLLVTSFIGTSFAQSCSSSSPCKFGCCSKYGSCGYGADYCGDGCQGTCDAKSECDPGWGPQYSQKEKCPLNVCCRRFHSKYGFCGTSSDFCGANTLVQSPSCAGASASRRTIGYYEGWSKDRPCDTFDPEQLPVGAYTHLNFAFAFIDPSSFAIAPMDASQVPLYSRLTALKEHNPGLEVWISIGGWSMNDPNQPTAKTFSQLAGSISYQQKFFSSLLSFLSTYGFDGVDLDWEYPVAPERSGSPSDFDNYVVFVKNLRRALDSSGHNYGLSLTLPASYWYLRNFDIVNLEQYVDWFNMLTYDLHGVWDANDPYIGSVIGAHTNLTEINSALNLLWRNKIDPGKVVLGLGFYGRSFTLTNPSCSNPGCGFAGGGTAGACTQTSGILSYAEISDKIAAGANVRLDSAAAVKIATFEGNQWVSYDDGQTLKMKIDYANRNCLAGTMVWAADLDTANGAEASNLGASTGQTGLSQKSLSLNHQDPQSVCQWSYCAKFGFFSGAQCPSGTSSVIDVEGDCGYGYGQSYCCPANNRPTCRVAFGLLFCSGSCKPGEIEIGRTDDGCLFGSTPICCTFTSADAATGQCQWIGDGPNCAKDGEAAACPSDRPVQLATTPGGEGGVACTHGSKSLCCHSPSPYENCAWYRTPFGALEAPIEAIIPALAILASVECDGKCSPNQVLVATSRSGCLTGSRALCCGKPATLDDPRVIAFRARLKEFTSHPTCPVDEVIDKLLDPLWERDLQTPEAGALVKRDFASAGGNNFMYDLVSVFLHESFLAELQASAFDDVVGVHNLRADNYTRLLVANEIESYDDPAALVQEFLCDWDSAAADFDDLLASNQICTFAPVSKKARKSRRKVPSSLNLLSKRIFRTANGATAPTNRNSNQISTGSLLTAIINDDIPLLYTRHIAYNGRFGQDNILELAYDLRNAPQLQYQNGRDIFALLHVHTLELRDINGEVYPGVRYIGAYHGQFVHDYGQYFPVDPDIPPSTLWAVDHGYGPAARAAGSEVQRTQVLRCDDDNLWYPGRNWPPATNNGAQRNLENFGHALRQRNIFTQDTYFNWDSHTHTWTYPQNGREWQPFIPEPGRAADMSPDGPNHFPYSPGPPSGPTPP